MATDGRLNRIRARLAGHSLWRALAANDRVADLREFFELPPWGGYRLTPRRLFNLYLQRAEYRLGRTVLWSKPVKLTVEAANLCNLRCPACFTGAGERGRPRSHMSLELFRRLLDELGDTLCELEFYNWGEPLLAKHIFTMIEAASRRGISTTVSTNFSIPFDAEKAERLVASGLTVLGVSIDGACQETYAQYRVNGDLGLVLRNCRLVRDAKERLASATPRLVWEYHVFSHNVQDVEPAKALAADLGMELAVDKGWVIGEEWDRGGAYRFYATPRPLRCPFLWGFAVVNNDGGVAPCCGTFYREDDRGRLTAQPGDGGAPSFRAVWNNEKFVMARRFFASRTGGEAERTDVCFECPITVMFEDYRRHKAAGGTRGNYPVAYTANDCANYFWNRRPERSAGRSPQVAVPPPRPVAAEAETTSRAAP